MLFSLGRTNETMNEVIRLGEEIMIGGKCNYTIRIDSKRLNENTLKRSVKAINMKQSTWSDRHETTSMEQPSWKDQHGAIHMKQST